MTWANTFFVIRLLSPTDFGLAALAALFANFISLLNELGFSVALVQRQTRDEETLREVFSALLAMGVLFTLLLFLAAPLVGIVTNVPKVVPLVRLISIQFLAIPMCVVPQARLSMDMRFKELGFAGMGASLSGAAATLIVALKGGGAWSLIVGTVVMSLARALLLNAYFPWIKMPRLQLAKIRPFARFSGLAVLERTLWYWYIQVDSFVVARFLGAGQLGIYSVGRQLTSIPLERAMEILNSVALPAFSRVNTDLDQVRRGYLKALRLGAGYAFPVFWGLAAVSEPAVRLVLGEKWLPAVAVIELLSISMPLRMLNSFTAAAVTSINRQDVNIKSLILAIIVVPTSVFLGSGWGVTGVAAAWALCFPIVYFYNVLLLKHALALSWRDLMSAVRPSGTAAACMILVLEALDVLWLHSLPSIAQLAIAIPFGAALFYGCLRLVSRDSADEILRFAKGMITHPA